MARIIKAPNVRLDRSYNVVEREKVLQHAEDEAAALLEAIQQEADSIRDMANQEAESLQQAAQQEVEDMRAQAQAEIEAAKEEARAQGHAEGLQSGQAEARNQVAAALKTLAALTADGQRILEGMFRDQESEIRELIADVVSRVIQEKIDKDDQVVVRIAKECINQAAERKNIRILVNENDKAIVEEWAPSFSQSFDEIENVTVDVDPRVDKGGVMIETTSGGVDGRVSRQTEIYTDSITES